MSYEHVNKKLWVEEVLRLGICKIRHDCYLFQEVSCEIDDICPLNLKFIERWDRQILQSVILLLVLILLDVSQWVEIVAFDDTRVLSIVVSLLVLDLQQSLLLTNQCGLVGCLQSQGIIDEWLTQPNCSDALGAHYWKLSALLLFVVLGHLKNTLVHYLKDLSWY